MTTSSQKINRLCKRTIAAMALPAVVAMFGTASAFAGAIFTTDLNCEKVNGNIYADKADVYLNGGPDGKGSALEANTEYCVRVSAPGGIPDLNAQECRVTTDENGHFSCFNLFECTGFADTDNPGGEYKVEVCPVDSAVCVFRSDNRCKSDNFKVRSSVHCPPGQEGLLRPVSPGPRRRKLNWPTRGVYARTPPGDPAGGDMLTGCPAEALGGPLARLDCLEVGGGRGRLS